jgi:hypothetical protein
MQDTQFHRAIGDWSMPLPHPRMTVYRNNVAAALVNALRVRFPVTEQLVGGEFFFAMAREFADRNRPASPVLVQYGDCLPDFIRNFAPAESLPYLADVAELENLWWRAYHAKEVEPLPASALAAIVPKHLGELRFELHPSTGLLRSPYAIGSIWLAHRGGLPLDSINVAASEWAMVSRPQSDVGVFLVSPSRHAFLLSLARGDRLADSVEQAQECDGGFDIGLEISELFTAGIVTGFHL